jgi:hypothetical protein
VSAIATAARPCGWTICPAPGRSAVARRGWIAMRRVRVIVALSELLSISGGLVTASPGSRRGRGWMAGR